MNFGFLIILSILRNHFIVHIFTFLQVKITGLPDIDFMLDGCLEVHIDHEDTLPIVRDLNENLLISRRYLLEDSIEIE